MSETPATTPTPEELRETVRGWSHAEPDDVIGPRTAAAMRWLSSNVSRLVDDARRLDWLGNAVAIQLDWHDGNGFQWRRQIHTPIRVYIDQCRSFYSPAASLPSAPAPEEPR